MCVPLRAVRPAAAIRGMAGVLAIAPQQESPGSVVKEGGTLGESNLALTGTGHHGGPCEVDGRGVIGVAPKDLTKYVDK